MGAFRDAIVETDRKRAPWYLIPANRKWYRDWAVMNLLVATLRRMDPKYPDSTVDPASITIT